MPEARALVCPQCGAAAALDSVQCPYCKAALQTVACPSCFGLMFFGSRFCPNCGARAASPIVKHESGSCPRCKQTMLTNAIGGFTLDECAKCAGVWLDSESFHEICDSRERQAAFIETGMPSAQIPTVDPTQDDIIYIPCPRCAQLMNRVNFADSSGVILNVCRDHGTWFDRDELREVIEFIRAGGLEKARGDKLRELQLKQVFAQMQVGSVFPDDFVPEPQALAGRLLRSLLG